jgi:hypothetical protein
LFGEYVCIRWFDCSLVSSCYLDDVIEKFIAIFVVSLIKVESKSDSLHFMCTCENFWNPPCAKLVIAQCNCDYLIENSSWNLWNFTWKFSNCEVMSFTLNKIITLCRWSTTLLWTAHNSRQIFRVLQFLVRRK